jgi:hypothetical protein
MVLRGFHWLEVLWVCELGIVFGLPPVVDSDYLPEDFDVDNTA